MITGPGDRFQGAFIFNLWLQLGLHNNHLNTTIMWIIASQRDTLVEKEDRLQSKNIHEMEYFG